VTGIRLLHSTRACLIRLPRCERCGRTIVVRRLYRKALGQINDAIAIARSNAGCTAPDNLNDTVTICISKADLTATGALMLSTITTVFAPLVLGEYESGLTPPDPL